MQRTGGRPNEQRALPSGSQCVWSRIRWSSGASADLCRDWCWGENERKRFTGRGTFFVFVLMNTEKTLITLSRKRLVLSCPRIIYSGSIFLNPAQRTADPLKLYQSNTTHCTWCVQTDTNNTPELKPPNSVAKVFLTHCPYPRERIRKQRLADNL